MAEKIVVDTDALQIVANSFLAVKTSVENVVDTLPSIKRMSAEAWPADDVVGDIFEANCQKLRQKCVELMVDIEKRKKMVDDVVAEYQKSEAGNQKIAGELSPENIF